MMKNLTKTQEVVVVNREEPRFKIGEIVYDIMRPSQKLIICRQDKQLYYCKPKEYPSQKDLVFFEWDLKGEVLSDDK